MSLEDENNPRVWCPTPDEIAAETAKIREGWSEAERLRRAGKGDAPWEAPTVTTPQFPPKKSPD